MRGVHLFPVRHHSPRASLALRAFLDAVKPKVVLVEGPSDAGAVVPVLVDESTVPPVAILGYRTDGTPGSALWPFASYSPEYQALLWAKRNQAEARFVDITVSQALVEPAAADLEDPASAEEESDEARGEPTHDAGRERGEVVDI